MERISIQHLPLQKNFQQTVKTSTPNQKSFLEHLEKAQTKQQLKISKHANERIVARDITITDQEWDLVSDKVFEAKVKGVKQPLVLLDQAALIVSAQNGTVITAMNRLEAKNQLFTNIDGTIVL